MFSSRTINDPRSRFIRDQIQKFIRDNPQCNEKVAQNKVNQMWTELTPQQRAVIFEIY